MIWLLGISAYLALVAFVFAACKVAGDYDREFLGDDDMYREHGIYDDATVFCYPVRELAAAWREHAQRHGITDPETELLAREAVHGSPRAGYRPAWYVPSTGELVVIIAAEPHWTEAQAIDWRRWMLEQLHANGSVTLYAHAIKPTKRQHREPPHDTAQRNQHRPGHHHRGRPAGRYRLGHAYG